MYVGQSEQNVRDGKYIVTHISIEKIFFLIFMMSNCMALYISSYMQFSNSMCYAIEFFTIHAFYTYTVYITYSKEG